MELFWDLKKKAEKGSDEHVQRQTQLRDHTTYKCLLLSLAFRFIYLVDRFTHCWKMGDLTEQGSSIILPSLLLLLTDFAGATDQIVMTPRKKTSNSTTIMMERRPVSLDQTSNVHVAGGAHKGIVINKNAADVEELTPAELSLEFCVFLINASTAMHTKESRQLRFWFKDSVAETDMPRIAQDFFKALVAPFEFPRDYVGFIKKIM